MLRVRRWVVGVDTQEVAGGQKKKASENNQCVDVRSRVCYQPVVHMRCTRAQMLSTKNRCITRPSKFPPPMHHVGDLRFPKGGNVENEEGQDNQDGEGNNGMEGVDEGCGQEHILGHWAVQRSHTPYGLRKVVGGSTILKVIVGNTRRARAFTFMHTVHACT